MNEETKNTACLEYRIKMLMAAGCTITLTPTGVEDPMYRIHLKGPYGDMSGGFETFWRSIDWAFHSYLESVGLTVLTKDRIERS